MKILMAGAMLVAAAVAGAADDPVARCRAAHGSDAPAHVACLEDALRTVGASPTTPEPASLPPAVSNGSAAPAAVAAAATAAASAATSDVPAATASGSAGGPTGLGAEQAKARQRPADAAPESVEVRIVSTGYNAAGLGVFRMADGQVWRETTPTPARHHLDPQREYAARIEKSRLGGYRLYVDGVRWMHKVERLQ